MGLARLVVIEGPDLGCEFDIPLRGGGIGRDAGNLVQLSDLSVSRLHCKLELHNGEIAVVDGGSRNRTMVNGLPITTHILRKGDEIMVGKTRLAFLPNETSAAAAPHTLHQRVTMEVGSRELLQLGQEALQQRTDGRARRYMAALAQLGDTLRQPDNREALAQRSCQAGLAALAGERAFVLWRNAAAGRMTTLGAALSAQARDTSLSLPKHVVDKVLAEGKALILDIQQRAALAAPLHDLAAGAPSAPPNTSKTTPLGLLYIDRDATRAWDDLDLMAVACIAHLAAAAFAGLEVREALVQENQALAEQLGGREIIGSSPATRAVLDFVAKVGPSDATVLLTGESGSGKEMTARAIHRASRRSRGPFVAVNCAALTESLVESELFGHEKGAFTGATERKIGRFELADKGTLFLDEVGELPPNCQTKFLRVLEERVFERVGNSQSISVDVRVVAATNRNLPTMVQHGQFREDLYYRLSVIHTVVPSLRERPHDIPELAEHFLTRLRSQVPRRIVGFTAEALHAMMAYAWPGNIRELKNAVERAIVLGDGERIRLEDLPPNITQPNPALQQPQQTPLPAAYSMPSLPAHTPVSLPSVLAMPNLTSPALPQQPKSLRELEREAIIAALNATGGNKAQAASLLEIDRSTLYKKIKDYGIEPP